MKVLFFNYEYPPLGGGAGYASRNILKEFSKIEGLEVDLITSAIDNDYFTEKINSSVIIHKVPIGKNNTNLHFQSQKEIIIYSWRAFLLARKLTSQNKYDLTHSFFAVPCGAISLWLKIFRGLPYVVSLRGSDVPGYSERFSFVYKILTPLIKYIWKEASFTVANSVDFKNLALKTNSKQEIKVIPNGVDTDKFLNRQAISDSNTERSKTFKAICGSRITPRKGIRFIIEALKILKDKDIKIELDVIGDGDEKETLENLVRKFKLEDQVTFLGFIDNENLPYYYGNANIYVSASLNEGMSNTMLEALSCGLPIISTRTGGTEEIITSGGNGYVVEMESSLEIAQKLEIIINDYPLENKMSQASRSLAQTMSWKNISRKYYNLYEEIQKNAPVKNS